MSKRDELLKDLEHYKDKLSALLSRRKALYDNYIKRYQEYEKEIFDTTDDIHLIEGELKELDTSDKDSK